MGRYYNRKDRFEMKSGILTFKKYDNINEELFCARKVIRENYYNNPEVKEAKMQR